MPTTDTEQQPDTTPPSPAVAGKTGKRASAPAAPEPPAAEQAAPESPAEDAAPQLEPPAPGWYRNTAATDLIVMPDHYPSVQLEPGKAAWLPDDPRHPNLERCDAPAPDALAADTAGSEK
jgi:hypothetical protein